VKVRSASSSEFDDPLVHAMQPPGRTSIDGPSRVRACSTFRGSERSKGEIKSPTAYDEAIRVFERGGSAKKANAAFIALIDRGFGAVHEMTASSSQRSAKRR
jgi:hypothetical protein